MLTEKPAIPERMTAFNSSCTFCWAVWYPKLCNFSSVHFLFPSYITHYPTLTKTKKIPLPIPRAIDVYVLMLMFQNCETLCYNFILIFIFFIHIWFMFTFFCSMCYFPDNFSIDIYWYIIVSLIYINAQGVFLIYMFQWCLFKYELLHS